MVSLGSRGLISPSHKKNYSLLLSNTHLRHISLYSQLLYPLTPKKNSLSELYKHKSLCFALWLRCITEKTAWPAASEWTIVNQLLRRGAEGHGNPLGSVRAGGKKRRDSPAGNWHREKPAGGGALSLRALLPWKFQPRFAELRVDVELPSHKENTSGLYQILLPFHSSLCTLSLPLSENWICCCPHHLFRGNSSSVDKQVPHLSLLPVSKSFNSLL